MTQLYALFQIILSDLYRMGLNLKHHDLLFHIVLVKEKFLLLLFSKHR
jgi:hypothetical protein